MEYLYFALIASSLVTSLHPSEEACLDRKALMEKEHKVSGKCVKVQEQFSTSSTYSTYILNSGSYCCANVTCYIPANRVCPR